MTFFLDVDVVENLASYDLLEEGVEGCGFAMSDVFLLHTARFKLKIHGNRQGAGERDYGKDVFARLRDFVNEAGYSGDAPHPDDSFLAEIDGIDPGEAILFSQASRDPDPDTRLATGDKCALRALARGGRGLPGHRGAAHGPGTVFRASPR